MSRHQFGPIGIPTRTNVRELMSPRDIARFWSKFDFNGPIIRPDLGPCHIWIFAVDKDGYGKFQISVGYRKQVHVRAHRVALELAIGPFEGLALHHCDTPRCGNGLHLYPGDQKKNIADREARGRHAHDVSRIYHACGEKHHNAKATETQAVEILLRVARGERHAAIARAMGMSFSIVNQIARRRTWRHVVMPSMEAT